jgi:hypothetical protein
MINSFGTSGFCFKCLEYAFSKVPRCFRVAPLADGKVITAKRSLAVMASHATLAAAGCVMIKRFRRRDLSSLRHTRSDLVAFVASYFLMLGMIESHAEGYGESRSP